MKNIFLPAGIVLVVAALWYWGGSSSAPSYSAGILSVSGDTFDFGQLPLDGGLATHDFLIENNSAEPVVVNKVYTSCMCTTALLVGNSREVGPFGMPGHGLSPVTDFSVAPGATVAVRTVFDPAAHGPAGIGLADRAIYLETNSASAPKVALNFTALVVK